MLYKILSKCTLVPMKCFCIYALWFLRNIVKMYFGLYQMLWKYILVSHKSWISIDVLLRLVDQSPNCISGTKISCPPRTPSGVLFSGGVPSRLSQCWMHCNAWTWVQDSTAHTTRINININKKYEIYKSHQLYCQQGGRT